MINVELYLDGVNRDLWNTMNQHFNIKIDYSTDGYYANYRKKNDCTIYVPRHRTPDSVSFTHELLHLYLPQHKIFIGGALERILKVKHPINVIFDKALYDHISNSLEHIKMLPLYLKMGYPIESFILDYYDVKLTDSEVDNLCKKYKQGILFPKYNRLAINYFIGKFFAVKADINTDNQYDKQMSVLNTLDHTLFSALDRFWNSWIEYDIEKKREAWDIDYHSFVDVLVNDLIKWSKHKRIV